MAEIDRTLGPIDVLVNNAGALGPIGPVWEADIEEGWRVIEANLRSAVVCSRSVLPAMIARRRGRIINVASGGGARPITYFSGYGVSKTAMIRFAECIAAEAKPFGVTVFSLGPGTVRTAMSEHSVNSPEGRKWLPWFRRIFDEGLDSPPERAAQLALVLASGRADPLSGCFLQVSDDVDAIVARADRVAADKLYSLRVRALDPGKPSAAAAAIAAAAERAIDDERHE
jgi:NAD(P)-dependent dehydrogenase (short-subunit alcohol dehydrogenase family)